jgi:hypothetical protein
MDLQGEGIEMGSEIGSIGRRNGNLLYERLYVPHVVYKFTVQLLYAVAVNSSLISSIAAGIAGHGFLIAS